MRYPQSKDKIEEAREVVKQYSTENGFEFDFIPVKIEDAFNQEWWVSLGEGDVSSAVRSLGIDISDECIVQPFCKIGFSD
jgi:cytoplasmic tRNA 2-thiolation protein 2